MLHSTYFCGMRPVRGAAGCSSAYPYVAFDPANPNFTDPYGALDPVNPNFIDPYGGRFPKPLRRGNSPAICSVLGINRIPR
jgi:hypothetical protein